MADNALHYLLATEWFNKAPLITGVIAVSVPENQTLATAVNATDDSTEVQV